MRPVRFTVFTDLDHTMIGRQNLAGGVPRATSLLGLVGGLVVPVTAKSIDEILATSPLLGLPQSGMPFIAVAESGAVIYAEPGVLPWADGLVTSLGRRLEYITLAPPSSLEEARKAAQEVFRLLGCSEKFRSVETMSPSELSKITGLPERLAALIPTHRFLAIFYSRDMECKRAAASALASKGYYVGVGRNFLHVGLHAGKARAVSFARNMVPILCCKPAVGLGDSDHDKEMLETVDTAFVIPPESGPPLRLSRGDYTVAPYPAPDGWVWAALLLALNPPRDR